MDHRVINVGKQKPESLSLHRTSSFVVVNVFNIFICPSCYVVPLIQPDCVHCCVTCMRTVRSKRGLFSFSDIFQTFANGCLCSAADGRHRLPERWSRCRVLVPTSGRSLRRAEHGGTYVLLLSFTGRGRKTLTLDLKWTNGGFKKVQMFSTIGL